jgi:antirestriction protein ArdC
MKTQELYQELTNQVIHLMDKHGSDWIKPWAGSNANNHNKFTKTIYSGFNCLSTGLSIYKNNFKSNEWGTFKQWANAGYKLKKGSKGTAIIFWSLVEKRSADADDSETFPIAKSYYIFNAEQIEGYEVQPIKITEDFTVERVDNIINSSKVKLQHGSNRACYIPAQDMIMMPEKSSFTGTDTSSNIESYYNTLLHELAHWTGHKSRLDRKLNSRFGNDAYAFEELIAELSAVFSTARLDISPEPRADNAKYLNNWKRVLRDDPRALQKACALAQKATDYLLQFDVVENKKVA